MNMSYRPNKRTGKKQTSPFSIAESTGRASRKKTSLVESYRTSTTSKCSVSPGEEEDRSNSLILKLKRPRESIQPTLTTAPDQKECIPSKISKSLDWLQINNCWQYMLQITNLESDLGITDELLNLGTEVESKEEIEIDLTDSIPSEIICKQCRVDGEQGILHTLACNIIVTDFGTFPMKSITERQREMHDLFLLHLSTIPAICNTCDGIYGYCDNWVSKIIVIKEIITWKEKPREMFCCLLCPLQNRRGYNALIHAKEHLSRKGMGLQCGKCTQKINEHIKTIDQDVLLEDNTKQFSTATDEITSLDAKEIPNFEHDPVVLHKAARNLSHESSSASQVSDLQIGKHCEACDNIIEETEVPPPILMNEEKQTITGKAITTILTLLFSKMEISMAEHEINKFRQYEKTVETSVSEDRAKERVVMRVSKTAIFCEQCGNIFDIIDNIITKLEEEKEQIISLFETIPEDERRFKCSINHSTPLSEDIMKARIINHVKFCKRICNKCRNETTTTTSHEDAEIAKIELYDNLVFDLSVLYTVCRRCKKHFSLCESYVPKLITVRESYDGHGFSYYCVLCQHWSKWSFDSLHHAATHLATKYDGLLCEECTEYHKAATLKEQRLSINSETMPNMMELWFPEAKGMQVYCSNCGISKGSLEDRIQMMFYLAIFDRGIGAETYKCRMCEKSELTGKELIVHAVIHSKDFDNLCKHCSEMKE